MKESKLFIKYHAKIALNELGESDIRGLKSHLNGSRKNSTLTQEELDLLLEQVQDLRPIITPAQAEKGLKWLKGCRYEFTGYEKHVIKNFERFRLIGFIDEPRNIGGIKDYRPIYRVEGASGFFDYFAYPWQTGAYSEKGRALLKIL